MWSLRLLRWQVHVRPNVKVPMLALRSKCKGHVATAAVAQSPHSSPSLMAPLPESSPLGPRVLPLGSSCVVVHVIHPSIVLPLLCHRGRKENAIRFDQSVPVLCCLCDGSESLSPLPTCYRKLTEDSPAHLRLPLFLLWVRGTGHPFPTLWWLGLSEEGWRGTGDRQPC